LNRQIQPYLLNENQVLMFDVEVAITKSSKSL